jgi:hypothetical protein
MGRGVLTYSPKISEDLIPILYKIGKKENIPMTKVVDKLIRDALTRYNHEHHEHSTNRAYQSLSQELSL